MRIESLKIHGVLRFEQPAVLPLSDLPPGLIAFVGMNGEGKTTMLEAPLAGLYRTFPSRDKSVLDYTHAENGYIETLFSLDGQGLFRARLSLDGPHRRSEGIITRILPDGTEAFVTADSKVTTYDAEIAKLLPPLKILLCSVFAAQNRVGSFASLDKKGRKELFSSLFGLDHYQVLSERAGAAVTTTQQSLGGMLMSRQTLAASIGDVDAGLPELARLATERTAILERRAELTSVIDAANASLALVSAVAQQHTLARQRRDALLAEGETITKERAKLQGRRTDIAIARERKLADEKKNAATDITRLEFQISDTRDFDEQIRRIGEMLGEICKDADARIANNRTLISHASDIRTAVKAAHDLDLAMRVALDESVADEIEAARLQESVLNAKALAAELAAKDLARAQADASLLGTVPCGGAGDYAACQFLTNAAIAKEKIPTLEQHAVTHAALVAELRDVRGLIERLKDRQRRNADAIAGLRQERDAKQKIADRLPALERAEEAIKGHEQRKADAAADSDRQRDAVRARNEERLADLREQISRRRALETARLEGIVEDAAQASAEVERDLAENAAAYDVAAQSLDRVSVEIMETAGASAEATRLQGVITGHRAEWDTSTSTLATITSQQETIARETAARAAKVQELEAFDARIKGVQRDLIEWQLLQKAFGRDGIPMLEIDAAGPTIAAYANDLLRTCGFGRFTVELITQEAKKSAGKDGSTMKETFEIKVWDSERPGDTARDLSDLSGGEQIIVDEAIKSAIALVANTRNPHPIQTCWRDETTGALHPEVAPKYVPMLRRVHELGKFHQTLFITHNPDAAIQADAQVIFADGGVTIALPPY